METGKADLVANIRLFTTEEGGLKGPIFRRRIGCLFRIDDRTHDCFILNDNGSELYPGQELTLELIFLVPNIAKEDLRIGDTFTLRDYRDFAVGKVLGIFYRNTCENID